MTDAVAIYCDARDRFLLRLGDRIREAGLPALHTDAWEHTAGEGEPGSTVTAPTFELERAIAGRRSYQQMAAFDWQGESAAYVRLFPIMGPSKFDLIEAAA